MKQEINQDGMIEFSEVYNPINLRSNAGEELSICMRDSGFEFKYEGEWYEAKNGEIRLMKKEDHNIYPEVPVGMGGFGTVNTTG